ncbi:MAG: hypothetical protein JWN04_3905 [Myxococcaceae bacterium]|nr:hypothetical protein [Myxococcaceae bacterium]
MNDNSAVRVLVIDDDEVALQAISDLLERAGFAVHALASPIGATQLIATQGIAAAVIDLNMPVMRGDRFVSLVRSWDRIRDLPIVLVSGESAQTIQEAVSHLSGVTVVLKSQMNRQLASAVNAALKTSSHQPLTEPTPIAAAARANNDVRAASSSKLAPVGVGARSALATHARSTLAAWKEFATGKPLASTSLQTALTASRAEAVTSGLGNTTLLLGSVLALVESLRPPAALAPDLSESIHELLLQLSSGELERLRAWDKSLVPTLLRSRVERARQSDRT